MYFWDLTFPPSPVYYSPEAQMEEHRVSTPDVEGSSPSRVICAMKAIIIEEKDCKALLDRLELAKFQAAHRQPIRHIAPKELGIGTSETVTLEDMHRWFHYVVTEWIQEQGATGRQ